jgi:hypothetical protein
VNTDKPVRVSAGRYTYRGVDIVKRNKLGFVFVCHPERGQWYWGGLTTLQKALEDIDTRLGDNGYAVRNGRLWHKAVLHTLANQ